MKIRNHKINLPAAFVIVSKCGLTSKSLECCISLQFQAHRKRAQATGIILCNQDHFRLCRNRVFHRIVVFSRLHSRQAGLIQYKMSTAKQRLHDADHRD